MLGLLVGNGWWFSCWAALQVQFCCWVCVFWFVGTGVMDTLWMKNQTWILYLVSLLSSAFCFSYILKKEKGGLEGVYGRRLEWVDHYNKILYVVNWRFIKKKKNTLRLRSMMWLCYFSADWPRIHLHPSIYFIFFWCEEVLVFKLRQSNTLLIDSTSREASWFLGNHPAIQIYLTY